MANDGSDEGETKKPRQLAKRYRIKNSVERLSKPTPNFSYMQAYYLPDDVSRNENFYSQSKLSKNLKSNNSLKKSLSKPQIPENINDPENKRYFSLDLKEFE